MEKNKEQNIEERKHPIIEDCEEMVNGKPVHTFMLSLNGMYISGITHGQMHELYEQALLAVARFGISSRDK